jgi:hypothetical protein
MGCACAKPKVKGPFQEEVQKDTAAADIQGGAAAYLAKKRAERLRNERELKAAQEQEEAKDLAAAEIQAGASALLAQIRAKENEATKPEPESNPLVLISHRLFGK